MAKKKKAMWKNYWHLSMNLGSSTKLLEAIIFFTVINLQLKGKKPVSLEYPQWSNKKNINFVASQPLSPCLFNVLYDQIGGLFTSALLPTSQSTVAGLEKSTCVVWLVDPVAAFFMEHTFYLHSRQKTVVI